MSSAPAMAEERSLPECNLSFEKPISEEAEFPLYVILDNAAKRRGFFLQCR